MIQTSEAGLSLIKNFEGLKLRAYKCSAGVNTIGYGHTHIVNPDDVITPEQSESLLKEDVQVAELTIASNVNVELTQHQFDALVSFVFNLGATHFVKSSLIKKLNSGDIAGAAEEFNRWVIVKGEPSLGLLRRREAEKRLFLS